jgi:hypothetical protein
MLITRRNYVAVTPIQRIYDHTHTHETVLTMVKCAVLRQRALMVRHSARLITNPPIGRRSVSQKSQCQIALQCLQALQCASSISFTIAMSRFCIFVTFKYDSDRCRTCDTRPIFYNYYCHWPLLINCVIEGLFVTNFNKGWVLGSKSAF